MIKAKLQKGHAKVACFILGDHGMSDSGEHCLGQDCHNLELFKSQAEGLKSDIDKAVAMAARYFAEAKSLD